MSARSSRPRIETVACSPNSSDLEAAHTTLEPGAHVTLLLGSMLVTGRVAAVNDWVVALDEAAIHVPGAPMPTPASHIRVKQRRIHAVLWRQSP